MSDTESEIMKRRTFAIISHPDAGKTTLTEKFLLYGGQLNLAGSVKGKATARHAVSDWMEIEKQRGISVTSSVLQFEYAGRVVNLLDTPGHQDFSEDTYRTLMAADSAVMVIDAAKGVEAQTRKLFAVCASRHIPIFTFINKLDRDAGDMYELLDEIERELGIAVCPICWPIGSGRAFQGIYDREHREVITYSDTEKGTREGTATVLRGEEIASGIGETAYSALMDEIEMLDGATAPYDEELMRTGRLSPVFYGSALTNFGVEYFLDHFLEMAPPPAARASDIGLIDPATHEFSAFVFKIQANMNRAHRDRLAFMRICSGRFDASMEVRHVQGARTMRLSQPQQIEADARKVIDEAYAGDIIGVFDPGIFAIGDTVTAGEEFRYEPIPSFTPEHFARVRQVDTMKRKAFVKGIEQLAQEGAVQIYTEPGMGMEEVIVGVVGLLQLDVLKFRIENEYGVEIALEQLPYEYIRTVPAGTDPRSILGTSDMRHVETPDGRACLLFVNAWSPQMVEERNPGLKLGDRVIASDV